MGCSNIFIITLTVCIVMRVSFSQDIQRDKSNPRYSVRTILSTMNSDFTSPYGNCSFPPKEVLNSPDLNTNFGDLDTCDRKMPSLETMKPYDSGLIMCLGLLELGLRLCSLEESYFKNSALVSIPPDKETFSSLILKLKEEEDPNLCINLKEGLNLAPVDEKLPLAVLKKWSLQSVFHETEGSCSRICFDYTKSPSLLCKLISWGYNTVWTQSDPKLFQPLSHSGKGNVDASVGSGTNHGESEKTEGSVGLLNQNVPDDHKNENDDKTSDFEVGRPTGTGNIPSSSEVTPIDGTKNDLKPVESKTPDGKNEDVATKQDADSTKSDPNQNEPRPVSSLVDGIKHSESGAEHSTTSNKQEVIKENIDKSRTTDVKTLPEGDNKDFDFGDKKIPIDGAGKGDEVRDSFDSALNQDIDDDDDDDLNVPEEPDQNSNNRESTGYKADPINKYPQDVFSNSNTGTFIQERYEDPEDSHFFSYFMAMVVFCIVGYVVFHNKQKILALALEGRSRRTPRRRPATANYHKLDNNLEEAVSSPCNTSVTHVIY